MKVPVKITQLCTLTDPYITGSESCWENWYLYIHLYLSSVLTSLMLLGQSSRAHTCSHKIHIRLTPQFHGAPTEHSPFSLTERSQCYTIIYWNPNSRKFTRDMYLAWMSAEIQTYHLKVLYWWYCWGLKCEATKQRINSKIELTGSKKDTEANKYNKWPRGSKKEKDTRTQANVMTAVSVNRHKNIQGYSCQTIHVHLFLIIERLK